MLIYSRPGRAYCCADLTDSYSLAAQGNKYDSDDIAQMSINWLK